MSFECNRCYRTFATMRSRYQHEEAVHPWSCDHCENCYSRESDLDVHVDEEHTDWHHCKICPSYGRSSRFRSEHSLDQHVQMAAGHQNYCYGCKRSFTSPNALFQHVNSSVHIGRNVKCPWCPAMFVNLTGVTHHLESDICPSGITRAKVEAFVRQVDQNNVITKKLITYEGYDSYEEPVATSDSWNGTGYQCYLCTRVFSHLSALNQHLRSPTHEQPKYYCPKCMHEFVRLGGLINHIESEKCGVFRFNIKNGFIGGVVQRLITN